MNIKKWTKWGIGLLSVGSITFFTGLINQVDYEEYSFEKEIMLNDSQANLININEFDDPKERFFASLDWGEDMMQEKVQEIQSLQNSNTMTRRS